MDTTTRYPLDDVLGTTAQVRVVRFLTSQTTRPSSAPEIANATRLTSQGARNALHRLVELGYVVRTGGGRTQLYAFRDDAPLQKALRQLFDVERARQDELIRDLRLAFSGITGVRSAWISRWPADARAPLEVALVSEAGSLPDVRARSRAVLAPLEIRYDLVIEVAHFTPADAPTVDLRSVTLLSGLLPQTSERRPTLRVKGQERAERTMRVIAEVLTEDPALRTKARHHIDWLLQEDQGASVHDLLEWRQILDAYSDERLYDFLRSGSPRAQRLYQSSPLIPALNPDQMDRLLAALEEGK